MDTTRKPNVWRVMLSKLWNQEEYALLYNANATVTVDGVAIPARRLPQSKGAARYKIVPKAGDIAIFIDKKHIVMRGVCEHDGFITGTRHQIHNCNIGETRPHAAANNEFAWVNITEILTEPEPYVFDGQRTWRKL